MGIFNKKRARQNITLVQKSEQQMTLADLVNACIELVHDDKKVYVIDGRGGKCAMKNGYEIFEFHPYKSAGCNFYHLSLRGGISSYDIKEARDGIYACDGQEVACAKLEELYNICENNRQEYVKVLKARREAEKQESLNADVMLIKSYLGR